MLSEEHIHRVRLEGLPKDRVAWNLGPMTPSDEYRKIAAELRAKATYAESSELAAQWEHLALCYLRLAEQADKNAMSDTVIVLAPKPTSEGAGA